MNDIIQPNFSVDIDGYTFLGRGSTAVDGTPGWSRDKDIAYRCANCGSLMPASFNDYYFCQCKAMYLDIDAGRFGSRYGDDNILVYRLCVMGLTGAYATQDICSLLQLTGWKIQQIFGGELMKNRTPSVLLIALVWLSILVVWAVRTMDNHLNQLQPPGAVGITGSPEGGFVVDQYVHVVPMGTNEIWIIDTSQQSVQVVTRDKDGTFHWSPPK